MRPLIFSDPLATVVFNSAFILWAVSESHIVSSKRGGQGESRDRGSKQRLIVLIGLAITAAFALAWVPVAHIPGPHRLTVILGVALILGGIALRRWAVTTLGDFFTISVEVLDDHRVVDTGPYRLVRHPAYTGALISLIGTAVALGSWLSLLAALVLGVAAFAQRIHVEEHALAEALGAGYVTFARSRKRLVPGVW